MSAAEIIGQISELPPDEAAKVEQWVLDSRRRRVAEWFARLGRIPKGVEMSEEEVLNLPRMISPRARVSGQ